jgi:regulator of PEP synthase PpsR (kinase-PPPase family)
MSDMRSKSIYVVSDGRGQTGTAVLKAALVQFQGEPYTIVCKGNVRTADAVERIVAEAAESQGVIFYTLVAADTRSAMGKSVMQKGVPAVDILGPALSALHDLLKRDSQEMPGLLYAHDRERFDRYDAMDYTLMHDDGQRPDELQHADVVLVGVSRAGKSVTCFYLASRGVRAANVPFVYGMPMPKELESVPKEKVIALVVSPQRLCILREARSRYFGISPEGSRYTNMENIQEESRAANRLISAHGWQCINASYKSVEEIAREIMQLRKLPSHEFE